MNPTELLHNYLVPSEQVPSKVSHSAAHLLLSLMTTVRASFLLQLKPIQDLYNDVSRGVLDTHSSEVQNNLLLFYGHFIIYRNSYILLHFKIKRVFLYFGENNGWLISYNWSHCVCVQRHI